MSLKYLSYRICNRRGSQHQPHCVISLASTLHSRTAFACSDTMWGKLSGLDDGKSYTEGFACPNHQCPYFGITDAQVHALVGDGTHGRAEQIQTLRCQACHPTFTARRHTPLYRLQTPSHQIAMVLTARACGLDPSAAERVFGYRQATITSLSVARGLARSDVTRALLSQPLAPASSAGRTAHQAAQFHTGALAGHRPLHARFFL